MDKLLAKRMDTMRDSATLALNARAKALASEGKTIYNLTAGELASNTPDYIQEAVATKLSENKYTPVPGLPELRSLIANQVRTETKLNWIEAKNVVVTGGAKPALAALFLAILDEGDEVILPIPAWVSYAHLIELAGGKVITVPTTASFDLNIDAIKNRLSDRTKAIIVNSPNNPTGRVYSGSSLQQLADLLTGTDIQVVSDDIYAKLVFEKKYSYPAQFSFDNIILINGFSKSQALTGWRIGYIIANETISKAVSQLLSHITGNASIISQEAAIAAMGHLDKPPAETIELLLTQKKLVADKLSEAKRLKLHIPDGAFYFFVDIREISGNSAEWCENLLKETGVVVVPGEAFFAPGFFRLTFAGDRSLLEEAIDKIVEFAGQDA